MSWVCVGWVGVGITLWRSVSQSLFSWKVSWRQTSLLKCGDVFLCSEMNLTERCRRQRWECGMLVVACLTCCYGQRGLALVLGAGDWFIRNAYSDTCWWFCGSTNAELRPCSPAEKPFWWKEDLHFCLALLWTRCKNTRGWKTKIFF